MRVISALRDTTSLLISAGWSVREGASHSRGTVDIAAQRSWRRGELEAVLHLLVIIDPTEGELAFAEESGKVDHAPITFALGDDDPAQRRALAAVLDDALLAHLHAIAYPREESITAPAHISAPAARIRASWSDGDFTTAFGALEGVKGDLLKVTIETLADDLELLPAGEATRAIDPFLHRCDLLHAIVITDRTMRAKSVRLEQARVVGADYRWIDVVRSNAFPDYVDALTRHYAARFAKRRFTAA